MRRDVPPDDPNFGKLEVCVCRKQQAERAAEQHLLSISNLSPYQDLTFENFHVKGHGNLGKEQEASLRQALETARHFAEKPEGWLVLMGDYGVGKTHLAAAIAQQALRQGITTLFLTVPDLLDWLRTGFDSEDFSFEERFEEIRNVPLLILDDLGSHNSTAWSQEKLFQLLDFRYLRRIPTVITSNQPLEGLEGRLRSRLQDMALSTVVRLNAPDYRLPAGAPLDPLLDGLALLKDRTFGNFDLRDPEKLSAEQRNNILGALNTARQFGEDPHGWLVFTGPYGTGKTHLAAAIGNYRRGTGDEVVFIVVPDFLDHLRATFSPSSNTSYDVLFERVRNTPLLIMDDFGTQSATPWAREKIYQLLNHRYNAHLATVITTAMRIEDIDERLRSRMLDSRFCTIFAIIAPPYQPASSGKPRSRSRPKPRSSEGEIHE